MGRNTPHGKGQWVRPVPSDCIAQNVNWSAFLNGRPDGPFDPFKLINWRLFWEFSGGNCAENMVHQIAWVMGALDLPLPSAAYMSGGVFSEKDGREVPDTIAVTLDFPNDTVVTWQSTFSNRHYELGDRIWAATAHSSTTSKQPIQYWPEKTNRPNGEETRGKSPNQDHMANWIDCVRSRGLRTPRRRSATARPWPSTCRTCRTATRSGSRWKKRAQLRQSTRSQQNPAAKRRKNAAHGGSRGCPVGDWSAPEGRKSRMTQTENALYPSHASQDL